MIERNIALKDIYNIKFNLGNVPEKDRYPIHNWNYELLNKTYEDINIFDVTRMIIQKIFIEVAVDKAIELLEENPFSGQRYESELMELLIKLDGDWYLKYKERLENIIKQAITKSISHEWLYDEEKEEYIELLGNLQLKLIENNRY